MLKKHLLLGLLIFSAPVHIMSRDTASQEHSNDLIEIHELLPILGGTNQEIKNLIQTTPDDIDPWGMRFNPNHKKSKQNEHRFCFVIGATIGIVVIATIYGVFYSYALNKDNQQLQTHNSSIDDDSDNNDDTIDKNNSEDKTHTWSTADERSLDNMYTKLTKKKKDEVQHVRSYKYNDIKDSMHEISNGYMGRLGDSYKNEIKKKGIYEGSNFFTILHRIIANNSVKITDVREALDDAKTHNNFKKQLNAQCKKRDGSGAGINDVYDHLIGSTALSFAAFMLNPAKVKLLIDYGADPSIPDDLGNSPLHHAVANIDSNTFSEQKEIVKMLLQQSPALLKQKNDAGLTPLEYLHVRLKLSQKQPTNSEKKHITTLKSYLKTK